MQVGPIKEVEIKVDLSSELSFCKKIYKAIYISIAHFTMATELRLLKGIQRITSPSFGSNYYCCPLCAMLYKIFLAYSKQF